MNKSLARPCLAAAVALSAVAAATAFGTAAGAAESVNRVSVSTTGEQGDSASDAAVISGDGRYVAFTSLARNLTTPNETVFTPDVYVRDRVAGTTELVSVTRKGVEGGGQLASISDGGRFVSFTSQGKNLVKADKNKKHDIFVRDLTKDKTERVSVSSQGDEAAKRSFESQVAGQGRFVVFTSEAGNLVEKDKNKKVDVFVHDRKKDKTELVSVDSRGRQAGGPSLSPSISANGRYVSFNSAPDLRKGGRVADALYLHDRSTDKTDPLVPEIGTAATISADGHALSFNAFRSSVVDGDTNNSRDVFVLTW